MLGSLWRSDEYTGLCDIVGSKFEIQWCYYIHFLTNALEKGIEPPSATMQLL